MRHRKFGRKLGMDSSERTAMFRNMVTSLLVYGQIKTTVPRAKELRRFVEHVITLGKRAPSIEGLEGDALRQTMADRVHLIRQARYWCHDDAALKMVFGEYAERFRGRPGGYTRVLKAGKRLGDNADMAIIQLIGYVRAPGATDEAPVADAAPEAGESSIA